MTTVLVVGRITPKAENVRGRAFAAGQTYFRAVARAGGVPVMLPPMPELVGHVDELLTRIDALVLHGGGDVDPRRYGEEPTAEQLYGIVDEHDEVELAVVRAALAADLPTLAICRGLQVLNVAMGGTLVQHVGGDGDHWFRHHPVTLEPDTRLARAIGATRADACHSVHHQAIGRLADGLDLVGRADDGMPEAVEVRDASWIVGVQWHPEDSADGDPQQQALFDRLVQEAAR